MSYDDFCRCTLREFQAICKAWSELREADSHSSWERMRMLATITVRPHLKSPISPQKLLPFGWDSKPQEAPPAPRMTREERRARIEELLKQEKENGR